MKKIAAYLGLIITAITLVSTIWAYSAEFTRMKGSIAGKADKKDVESLHHKVDKVICYLDKNECLKD